MKIIVCIKRVPDTAVKINIAADGKNIDKKDLEYVMGPYDEIAMEHAVRAKEKETGEVIALSLGSQDSEKELRKCLAMGADRAILLQTDVETTDSFQIAQAISKAIQNEQPDIILFGIKSVDTDNAQVPGMVASLLDIPYITTVVQWEKKENTILAESEVEGGHLEIESSLPCVLSIQKSNIEPRICNLLAIRKAKQKKLDIIPVTISSETTTIKLELPPKRTAGKIVGTGADAVPELIRLLKEEAQVI
ncbi:MAG TPA: electron transfer flavoprotein subunit beta/FixA family protein [Planctomycetota bacterium]|nr:electron transfer flavoprotein subunit beta/FixA family protein [Planctomycetota bacterium]